MKSCRLCGSDIVGQDAALALEEYRDMVAKAKAAEALVGAADQVAQFLWSESEKRPWPESDVDDLVDDLRQLREEIREASRELGTAARRYREANRESRRRATG